MEVLHTSISCFLMNHSQKGSLEEPKGVLKWHHSQEQFMGPLLLRVQKEGMGLENEENRGNICSCIA